MQLLVIRHARAERVKDFAKTGADDDLRPLTEDGRERMRAGAAGLHRLVDTIDVLATSPLVRSQQTAEILAAEFGRPEITQLDQLRPLAPLLELGKWLQDAGSMETIAIVGHEANLTQLVGWLLTGRPKRITEIKKGAAALLDVGVRSPQRGLARSARLLWLHTPRQLRMLGETTSVPDAPADAQRAKQ